MPCDITSFSTVFQSYQNDIKDGWCDFTSFFIVFQSLQEHVWVIMKAVCKGTPFTIEKIHVSSRFRNRD